MVGARGEYTSVGKVQTRRMGPCLEELRTEFEDTISHSVDILLCDLGPGTDPLWALCFFFSGTDGRHKGAGSQAVREEAPHLRSQRPVGICQPEGDFLGPARFPAQLTSPLDGWCPELAL